MTRQNCLRTQQRWMASATMLLVVVLGLSVGSARPVEAQAICQSPITRSVVNITANGCQSQLPSAGVDYWQVNSLSSSGDFRIGVRYAGLTSEAILLITKFGTNIVPVRCNGPNCATATRCQIGVSCVFSAQLGRNGVEFTASGGAGTELFTVGPVIVSGPLFGGQATADWSMTFPNGSQIAPGQIQPVRFAVHANTLLEGLGNGSFDIGPGLIDPGLFPAQLPADGFCGPGSTARSDGTIVRFRGLTLAGASSCNFDFGIGALGNLTGGTVNFLTSPLTITVNGEQRALPAQARNLTKLSGQLPILSIDTPDIVQNGAVMEIGFRYASPYINSGHTNGSFDFDPVAFAPGLTIVQEPQFTNCGPATSTVVSATLRHIRSIDVSNGGFCQIRMSVKVPTPAYRTNYSLITGPIGGSLGGVIHVDSTPPVQHFTVAGSNENLRPATMTMQVNPPDALGGVQRRIRYNISLPAGLPTPGNISFDHNTAHLAAGVTLDTGSLPLNPCGAGSSITSAGGAGFFTLNNGRLLPGQSCSFEVAINVPVGLAPGSYTQLTSPVRSTVSEVPLTSPAATAPWSVTSPDAATLAMQLIPASAVAGAARSIRYTVNLPASGPQPDRIEFDHDVAFFVPEVMFDTSNVPSNPCGAGSSFVSYGSASQYQLLGGKVAPGASCTFDVPILTAGVAPGNYEQRTSSLRTVIGATTFTSPAASSTLTVAVPPLPSEPATLALQILPEHARAGEPRTFRYTLTLPANVNPAQSIGFSHNTAFEAPGVTVDLANTNTTDPCGAGSSLNVTSGSGVFELVGGTLEAGTECSFDVTVDVPNTTPAKQIYSRTSQVITVAAGQTLTSPLVVTRWVVVTPFLTGATLDMQVTPASAPANARRTITYTISIPTNAPPLSNAVFGHDIDHVAPSTLAQQGIFFDHPSLPTSMCGTGTLLHSVTSVRQGSGFNLANLELTPGFTCTFSAAFDIPDAVAAGLAPGTYSIPTRAIRIANTQDEVLSAAQGTFTVVGPTTGLVPLEMSTHIDGGPLRVGSPVDYVVTVSNPNGVDVTNADMAVGLGTPSVPFVTPTGMSVSFSGFNGGCTGGPAAAPGGAMGFIASGVTVPANSTCTATGQVQVDGTVPVSSYPVTGFTDFTDSVLGDFPKVFSRLTPIVVAAPDTEAPVLTAPSNQTANTDAGQAFARLDVTGLGSVTDDSGSVPAITYRVGASVLSGPFDFPIGDAVVTMDAVDAVGNVAKQVSFTVTVTDNEAPVISVTPPTPVTAAFGASTASVSFTASATDNSGDPVTLVFELANSQPITSPHDFPIGTTAVTVRATDNAGNAVTESFDVVVNASTLLPPVATDNRYVVAGTNAGGPSVTLAGNVIADQIPDSDPDASGSTGLIAVLVSGPSGGPAGAVLSLNPDGSFTYAFANNTPGSPQDSASFTYRVTDPDSLQSNTATVTITIHAVPNTPNTAPVARNDSFSVFGGAALNGNVLDDNGAGADADPDSNPDPLSVLLARDVADGTLSLRSDGSFSYTPNAGFAGTDGFEYTLTDGAGTATGVVAITVSRPPDTTPPVITVPADIAMNTDAGQATAAVTYSVSASDDVDGDISASVTLSHPSGTVFPIGTTTVTADVSDASGNAATQVSFTVTVTDNEVPVISVTAPAPVSVPIGVASASVAFSAGVSDNSGASVTLVFELANSQPITSPHDFPVGTTTVTVRATDGSGNEATRDFDVVVTDGTPPTIALSADTTTLRAGQTATITFKLSANATDFEETDVAVTGGTLSGFSGSGRSYGASFTPDRNSSAEGRINVASGRFTDATGNANADGADADNTLIIVIDTVRPSAAISTLSGPSNGVFTATITLSEPSTDFAVDDLVLVNAAAVFAGSGDTYTVTLTPQGNGPLSVTVATSSFSDAAGNRNAARSNTQSAVFDGTPPTVEITGLPETFSDQAILAANITFSEPVTGFEAEDLSLGNATSISLSGSGARYFVRIRPTGRGDITMQVPANAAQDGAGNGNLASSLVIARNETVEKTQRQIAQFMAGRANQLVTNQPDLTCHLRQSCAGGSTETRVTRGQLSFNFNSRPEWPVWFQLSGTRTSDGSANSDYLFGAFGSHRAINDNTLVGGVFEFDHVGQSDGASKIEGTGWLVGPYYVTRLPNQPLYFEGRLLAGMSHNRIQPFGTYTDNFETRRVLALLKVSGQLEYGETTLIPSLAGSYTTDTQLAYTDSLGNRIPEQGIELGQLELGLDFETPATILGQLWTLGGGASAIYSTTSGSGAAQSVVTSYNGGRARLELSGSTQFDNGARLNLGASYDGIGAPEFEAIGLEIGFQWEF
ncbi:Ig-like domain-containing protein [Octadecabacter ascidiaceicola]|uniref:HYR domain protein n=1 Tax=Octadecabacter ascidiaceicola TaxID=1655543 RepID=A0A238K8I5_9RHOB|nr:Ig-like domain-containing protein [Octadecabacter ascidiaceicola]SMX38276.1 HYR domain protein [Octadecabacter ascidiaceicola]